MKNKEPSKKGFIVSIVVLLLGMSIGLFLLSLAYQGPSWVEFVVFIVYITIVYFLIRFSYQFAKSLPDKKDKNNDRVI